MSQEVWRDIIGYGGVYQISNMGQIKSYQISKTGKIRVPALDKDGYKYLVFNSANHEQKTVRVHRLVATTFIQNPLNLPQVNHKNGIKQDNRAENLEWVTASQNAKHAYSIGLKSQAGIKNACSKLTNSDVLEIYKTAWEERDPYWKIAQNFNIHRDQVGKIKYGITWAHITNHNISKTANHKRTRRPNFSVGEQNSCAILKEAQVIEIKKLLKNKEIKQSDIANLFKVSRQVIYGISSGKTWKHITI